MHKSGRRLAHILGSWPFAFRCSGIAAALVCRCLKVCQCRLAFVDPWSLNLEVGTIRRSLCSFEMLSWWYYMESQSTVKVLSSDEAEMLECPNPKTN